jgi:hypothetical protein
MSKGITAKQDFIGKYLDRKMKNHGLHYGMDYLNKVAKHEEDAEKLWKKKQKVKK